MAEELEETRAENRLLRQKLQEQTAEKRKLIESSSLPPRLPASLEDEFQNARCSTIREVPSTMNESLLMSTMSNLSFNSMNVPECKPSPGEAEIDKKAYDHWKDILETSLQLVNATDETVKMGIFKIKAGVMLMEILHSTTSAPGTPDETSKPYSNAISRLDGYFGSRTYMLSQRSKLMGMVQEPGEGNIQFVRRVGAAAKLCGYSGDEEMEAVVRTITKGTIDSRVRVLAHRNWVNQGSLKDLIDQVRDRDIEKLNEEEFQRSRNPPAAVASVVQQRYQQQRGGRNQPQFVGRWPGWNRPNRFHFGDARRGNFGQGTSRGSANSGNTVCWRCSSIYHTPSKCSAVDKICRNCNSTGHYARTCTSTPATSSQRPAPSSQRPVRRRLENELFEPNAKIAAVERSDDDNTDEDSKENTKVQENIMNA